MDTRRLDTTVLTTNNAPVGVVNAAPLITNLQVGANASLTPNSAAPSSNAGLAAATVTEGNGLKAEYFDNKDFTNLKVTRSDAKVDFRWGYGSPDPTIAPDTFSVRWTGKIQARYSQNYTFYTASDDGVRLWINNKQIVNNWTSHPTTENRGTIALTAGQQYDIRLEYYEEKGGATIQLGWSSQSQAREIVPQSQLYNALLPPLVTDGDSGNNTLNGDENNNTLRGFAGNDILRGNGGNDILSGGTGNDTLNGDDGNDTASYADASNRMTVNLTTGIANRMARIMPLGDSITWGASGYSAPQFGGYRSVLWNRFQMDGLTVDFVGSRTDGSTDSTTLGDRDHDGHPGDTINQIDARINTYLSNANPDVVLLIVGTNDTSAKRQNSNLSDTAAQIAADLGTLIDHITSFSPDLTLLVGSIPPIRPNAVPPPNSGVSSISSWVQKAVDYNNLIPGVITSRPLVGNRLKFVDMRTLLTTHEVTAPPLDSGLHPTTAGYEIIGNTWYSTLNTQVGTSQGTFSVDQDTLISIENVIGSAFNDTLIGNAAANSLNGGNGDDQLTGSEGNDVLTGGSGADTFVYRSSFEGGDVITDFGTGDIFEITAAGFSSGLLSGVSLSTSAASTGVLVNSNLTISSDPTFLYKDSALWFDVDGMGAGLETIIATLQNGPATLDASHFRIV